MAFSSAVKEVEVLGNGLIIEHGTFNGAAVTTGTITADTSGDFQIAEIIAWGASSDGDDNSLVCATDAGLNKLKLTFASGDTGKYWFIGKAK